MRSPRCGRLAERAGVLRPRELDAKRGYVLSEIRQLGRERICEFHAKENGFLLGQGRIDFPAVRKAMDDIGYTGWIQIEGAVPEGQPLIESHMQNVRFMRTHFS